MSWTFNPYGPGYKPPVGGGDSGGETPDNQDPDAKCPYVDSTNVICDPRTSGTINVYVDCDPFSGCRLYPPLTGYLFALGGDDGLTRTLLKSFPTSPGDRKQFYVDEGDYLIDISGQFNSSYSMATSVTNSGFVISGIKQVGAKAKNCQSQASGMIVWSGWNSYSVDEAPQYAGYSFSGFSYNLPVGAYNISFEKNGCHSQSSFAVAASGDKLAVRVESTGFTCGSNGNNGTAAAYVSGGYPPYQYFWTNVESSEIIGSTQKVASLAAGQYMLMVKDQGGCQLDSPQLFSIGADDNNLKASIVFTSQRGKSICCQEAGTAFTSMYALANGGTQPYSYLWSDGFTGANRDKVDANSYSVTVTDAKGCSATSDVQTVSYVTDCFKIKWDYGDGTFNEYISPSNQIYSSANHQYSQTGLYNVKMMVVDGQSHRGAACHQITVNECPPFYIGAAAGAGGSITPSGRIPVKQGESQTFNSLADSGYYLRGVYVDGTNFGPLPVYTFSGVQTDHSIFCDFAKSGVAEYTIYASGALYPQEMHYPSGRNSLQYEVRWCIPQPFFVDGVNMMNLCDSSNTTVVNATRICTVSGSTGVFRFYTYTIGYSATYQFTNILQDHSIYTTYSQCPPPLEGGGNPGDGADDGDGPTGDGDGADGGDGDGVAGDGDGGSDGDGGDGTGDGSGDGSGDGGSGDGGGGSGGGSGGNPNANCGCCMPTEDGSVCSGASTVSACQGAGGKPINVVSIGSPLDPCAGTFTIDGCGKNYCSQNKGYCCTEAGCELVTKCDCTKNGGAWFGSDSAACQSSCYCKCCYSPGNCGSGSTSRKQCGKAGGHCVDDCASCQTSPADGPIGQGNM